MKILQKIKINGLRTINLYINDKVRILSVNIDLLQTDYLNPQVISGLSLTSGSGPVCRSSKEMQPALGTLLIEAGELNYYDSVCYYIPKFCKKN